MRMTWVLPLYFNLHSVNSSVFASQLTLWGGTHLILQKLHSSKCSHKSQSFGYSTWLELLKSRVLGSRRLSSLQNPIAVIEKKKSSLFVSLKCFPKLYFSLICVKPQTKKILLLVWVGEEGGRNGGSSLLAIHGTFFVELELVAGY